MARVRGPLGREPERKEQQAYKAVVLGLGDLNSGETSVHDIHPQWENRTKAVYPFQFHCIPDRLSLLFPGVGMYELNNVRFQVQNAPVGCGVEMSRNTRVTFGVYGINVGINPLHQGLLSLAHILLPASNTAQAVDNITALARNILHGYVASARGMRGDAS